jgi:hypothetical protein
VLVFLETKKCWENHLLLEEMVGILSPLEVMVGTLSPLEDVDGEKE